MKIWKRSLINASIKAIYGYMVCKWLRIKYGKKTYIFLARGKTGDIFLYFRFLKSFLEKNNIKNYVIIGDCKNLKKIKDLYPEISAPCMETSERLGLSLQTAYCFFGADNLHMSLSLMWDVDLPYNRCATRLTSKFNFIESYYWFLFDLNEQKVTPVKASFSQIDRKLEKELKRQGIVKGKTVILSPYAYCVRTISPLFWRLIGADLEKKGYKVMVMLDGTKEKNEFGFPSVFFKYKDSVAVLEYAGYFIGLRSGFCDIIAGANCKKVILYPTLPKEFDGSVHRADIYYSSLKCMGLSDDAVEITLPFARDISNFEPETEDFALRMEEDKKVVYAIKSHFPELEYGV